MTGVTTLVANQGDAIERAASDTAAAEEERKKRQRMRSLAIALALGGLVLLFYIATIVRLGGNALNRPM